MRKNVAGQVVAAQLINSSDGSPVVAGVTSVFVTGDNGAQGAGAGAVAHKGNGCWHYLPTLAETNFDHIDFTFSNPAAITTTVQVYTSEDSLVAGAVETPITITDNLANPLDGVEVWITTDALGNNVVVSGETDALGLVTFWLDPGSYYVRKQLSGYNFTNPEALVVV